MRARRESFGAIMYSEKPGYVAYVDHAYADSLNLPQEEQLPSHMLRAPVDVHIALTTRCNKQCIGCYAEKNGDPPDMPVELAEAILRNLASLKVFSAAFGGGEPFLHPQLFEIADYARSLGLVPNITTNGTLISADTARKSRVFGTVHLSLHALEEQREIETAAKTLVHAGIHPGLNLLLTCDVASHLDEIFRWARKCRFQRILLLRPKPPARQDIEDYVPLLQRAMKLSRRHFISWLVDCSLFPEVVRVGIPPGLLEKMDATGCMGANVYAAVTVDGQIKPCSFWPELMGSAVNVTPDTWISSPCLNTFRQMKMRATCDSCGALELCNGGCRLLNEAGCKTDLRTNGEK